MPNLTAITDAQSLKGGTSADTLNDGAFLDVTLNGDAGNDRYIISNTSAIIIDSAGTDTIESSVDFSLSNTPAIENLVLSKEESSFAYYGEGNAGANSIVGNDNGNTLVGLQGSDTIVGGAGDDLVYGAQATEKLGTAVFSGVDLTALITPDADGNLGFLTTLSDGSSIAQVNDPEGTYFVKLGKNGAVDTSFGNNGAVTPFDAFGDPTETLVDASMASVTLLVDGKFLVSGLTKDGLEAYARLTGNGGLDTSFGSAGYFVPDLFVNADAGETLLAQFGDAVNGFLIAKTTETGTKFQVITKDGKSAGTSAVISSSLYDFSSLAIDPNVQMQGGKVVVVGVKLSDGSPAVVRLTSSGAIDSSGTTAFGVGGFLSLDPNYDYTNATFEVRTDAIYVSGALALDAGLSIQSILRFTANGIKDGTFGTNGILTLTPVDPFQILSDGRILETLYSDEGTSFRIYAKDGKTSVETTAIPMEYDGIADYPEYPASLALVQGTKIVLEGRSAGDLSPMLIRLNADGTLDTSFGEDGYFTAPETEMGESFDFSGFQVSVLADGKLLATGIKQTTQYGESAIVVRLTADGKYDTSFGVNGILASEPGEGGVDFRVLSNGAIILVDGSLEGSAVTMFSKDGKLDSTFGSDPAGVDSLFGGDGNDTLVSGAGVSIMVGGLGDDEYIVNNSANIVLENATIEGGGIDTIYTTFSFNLGANSLAAGVENLIYKGSGASLAGNALANYIEGDFGNDTITVGKDDTVDGFGGNDLYIVNDTLTASTMHLVKTSEEGDDFRDTLRSAVSYDLRAALDEGRVINVDNLVYTSTLGGNLRGTGWDGIIVGNKGKDTLSDGTGNTPAMDAGSVTLVGGDGDDLYLVEKTNIPKDVAVYIVENSSLGGNDTVQSKYDFSLATTVNVENLVLTEEASLGVGSAGANRITGNTSLDNTLIGLQGSDTIVGGSGNDLIYGAQATERLGTVVTDADLSSLIETNINGLKGFAAILSDSSFVLQGDLELIPFLAKTLSTGAMDLSFGGDGGIYLSEIFGDPADGVDASGASMILQTVKVNNVDTQKFIVSGLTKDDNEAYARLNANGTLDTTFGANGYLVVSAGEGEQVLASFGDPVAGLLVAITTDTGTKFQVYNSEGKPVAKPTGTPPEISTADFNFSSLGTDPNVQLQGGKIVIVGSKPANPTIPVLVRLTSTGALDSSVTTGFGSAGYMTLSGGSDSTTFNYTNANFEVRADAVYVTGVSQTNGVITSDIVLRYNADGKSPATFAFSASDDVHSVRVLADGSIVGILNVEGETPGTQFKIFAYNSTAKTYAPPVTSAVLSNYDFSDTEIDQLLFSQGGKIVIEGRDRDGMTPVLVRLNANGTVDTTFGVNGYFMVPEAEEGETYNFMDLQISVLSDGKLLATGIKQTTSDGEVAIIARLTADGKFDTTFGVNGILSSEPGMGGADFRVLNNGAIILVDGSSEGSSVTMFTKDGKVNPTFGSDPAGADSLVGGDGNDTLVSGAGATTMVGGLGDDEYIVNNSANIVLENATIEGGGIDTIYTTFSFNLGANSLAAGVENLIYKGSGASLAGNALANYIEGDFGNDTINGGTGADTMSGGAGNDFYIVDNAGDTIDEDADSLVGGIDTVTVTATYTLGSGVENLILGGTATISGNGNSLDNSLIGNTAANSLFGGGGNDTLNGGASRDTMDGGAGDDYYVVDVANEVIIDSDGTDTVESRVTGATGYTLANDLENLVLGTGIASGTGNSLNNRLVGNSVANTLNGGEGNDTLDGGAGVDSLIGGNGNDHYIVDNAGDRVIESTDAGGSAGGIDTVEARVTGYTLANGVENLVLGGTVAAGTGNTLDNMIAGNSVANTINGGTGADAMAGGAGNDLYLVDNAGDTIDEDSDSLVGGIDTVSVTVTYTLGSGVENLILGGTGAISGTGNSLDNLLTGNSAANSLFGGNGNDTLNGGAGSDTMDGGNGDDYYLVDIANEVIIDSGGTDTVESRVTGVTGYTLAGGLENLVLGTGVTSGTGNSLNNRLVGNSVANTLNGGDGNDTLDGGAGVDSLIGGNGNDYFIVDNAGDRVIESTDAGGSAGGIDTVEARVTGYTLANGVENLVLGGTVAAGTGNTLDNMITGNAAANSLNGGAGSDTLMAAGANNGFGQKDTLTGGAGVDYFILGNEWGAFYDDGNASNAGAGDYAYITDFTVGQDMLVLSGSASDYFVKASGISGLTGTVGIFKGTGVATDELIAVLKSANSTTLNISNTIATAEFLTPTF